MLIDMLMFRGYINHISLTFANQHKTQCKSDRCHLFYTFMLAMNQSTELI